MFNNTLIKKSIFNSIKFDPITDKYGHDDTLFAYQTSLAKHKVKHIDNAVMHGYIDDTVSFINKSETALDNLLLLYKSKKIQPSFVKILKLYKLADILKARSMISFLFKKNKLQIQKQLTSSNPSLLLFKIYKIGYLCSLNNNTKLN